MNILCSVNQNRIDFMSVLPSLHRILNEDLENHEKQILKGWKELKDKREIIELKEVCV